MVFIEFELIFSIKTELPPASKQFFEIRIEPISEPSPPITLNDEVPSPRRISALTRFSDRPAQRRIAQRIHKEANRRTSSPIP